MLCEYRNCVKARKKPRAGHDEGIASGAQLQRLEGGQHRHQGDAGLSPEQAVVG
jgi:hypothetical protein